jgi:hypothetical protein
MPKNCKKNDGEKTIFLFVNLLPEQKTANYLFSFI